MSWVEEHPGLEKETSVSSSGVLADDRRIWTSCVDAPGAALAQLCLPPRDLQCGTSFFSQALSRAAGELLGCMARDSSARGIIREPQAWERAPGLGEGGRRNASVERRSGKCCELIRAGLACLDKPRWACKALNPGRAIAYRSCAVGFTCICFQAGLLACSSPRCFQC